MVFKINRMNEVLPKVTGDKREKVDKIRVAIILGTIILTIKITLILFHI